MGPLGGHDPKYESLLSRPVEEGENPESKENQKLLMTSGLNSRISEYCGVLGHEDKSRSMSYLACKQFFETHCLSPSL